LADWVERLLTALKASAKLFADETTAPVLDPGRGRTKTGQLWASTRVAYIYAPDRKATQPLAHLSGFAGILQVDGYAGYRTLAKCNDVQLAFCWSHCAAAFTKQTCRRGADADCYRSTDRFRKWNPFNTEFILINPKLIGKGARESRILVCTSGCRTFIGAGGIDKNQLRFGPFQ
jgi:Transposase IS66 family